MGDNCTYCPPCPEQQSMFSILTVFKVLFFTPIIFFGGLVTSIAYDYVTFKEEDEKTEEDKKSD